MTEITENLVREQSREIILNHARDVEYMSIGEHLADFDEFAGLPEDEFDQLQGRIDKMIRNAKITVTWRDEDGPTVEQLAARVAELESRLAQARHTIDDQAHRIQSDLDRIAELEAERDNDLCVMVAFLRPNARGEAAWTAILANHFGKRAQELVEDAGRFAAAYSRVNAPQQAGAQ